MLKFRVVFLCLLVWTVLLWTESPAHAQRTGADHHISYYQQLLRRNADNARAYHGLADALIRKARETGEPSYFNRAEEALNRSLERAPKNAAAMRHLAYVFYSRHEFDQAAMQAKKAIEIDDSDANSYGVLGDAALEVGKYEEAKAAFETMMRLDDSLYSRTRSAGLKSMRGDTDGAMADMERAIAAGKDDSQPAESIAWAEWQFANDHFNLGNLATAETYYMRALKTYPNYYRALAGMAQVRAAQEHYGDAVEYYKKAIAILPLPEYVAALGDVYTRTNRPAEARKQYALVEYIGKLNALNKILYNRELAYFYADHEINLTESLELARREIEYRKDIYAYDLLAWSLHKNRNSDEARAAIQEALKLGTKDAKLFFHAGMIYYRLGQKEVAKEYLTRALATNPHFHVLHAETAAQTLKQLQIAPAQESE
jgi:tetratricopeptide (TPR) repeat protein